MRRLPVLVLSASASFLMAPTCGGPDPFGGFVASRGGRVVVTHAGGAGPLVFERTPSGGWSPAEVRVELSEGLRATDLGGFAVDFSPGESCLRLAPSACPDAPAGFACELWSVTPTDRCAPGRYGLQVFATPAPGLGAARIEPGRLDLSLVGPPLPGMPVLLAVDAAEATLPSAETPADTPESGHVVAVAGDGTHTWLVGWGWNGRAQLAHGLTRTLTSTGAVDAPVQPWFVDRPIGVAGGAGATLGWRAVVTAGRRTVAVGSDGRVYAQGENRPAAGGNGARPLGLASGAELVAALTPVPGLAEVVAVSGAAWPEPGGTAGEDCAGFLALDAAGRVYTWGCTGAVALVDSFDGAPLEPMVAVAGAVGSGGSATGPIAGLLLGASGVAYRLGGAGAAKPITHDRRFVQVAAGARHGLLLDEDGALHAVGENDAGQLGVPGPSGGLDCDNTTCTLHPAAPLAGRGRVVAVAAKRDLSYALTADGTLYAWGRAVRGLAFPTPVAVAGAPLAAPGAARLYPGFVQAAADDCRGLEAIELTAGGASLRPVGGLGQPARCPVQVSVTVTGTGAGRVRSAPSGLDCPVGMSCAARFPAGAPVELRAETDDEVAWGGDCAAAGATPSAALTPTGDLGCTLTLTRRAAPGGRRLRVVVTDDVPGRVVSAPDGLACASTPGAGALCEADFGALASVRLRAYPAMRTAVTTWGGACASVDGAAGPLGEADLTGPDPTCTVSMRLPPAALTAETAEVVAGAVGADTPMTLTPLMDRAAGTPIAAGAVCQWTSFVGAAQSAKNGCAPLSLGPAGGGADVGLVPGAQVRVYFEFFVPDTMGNLLYGRFDQPVVFDAQ